MISFNYFGLSHSPFPCINTYKLIKINIKIGVTRKGNILILISSFQKLLRNLIQMMTFYLLNNFDFQSFKFPMDFIGLLYFVC